MPYVDISKEYAEAVHVCDACLNNMVQARLPPDEIVTDIEAKDVVVKGEVTYKYSCKIGLDNSPKVVKCNQFLCLRRDR